MHPIRLMSRPLALRPLAIMACLGMAWVGTRAHAQEPGQGLLQQVLPALELPAPGSQQAVAIGLNSAHSGGITLPGFTAPLQKRWSVDLGRTVSYPLIADGRVFVTVGDSDSRYDYTAGRHVPEGKWLYALDAADGRVLWKQPIGGYYWRVNACYEAGRVIVLDMDGLMTAYEAATGERAWSRLLPYRYSTYDSVPTARNGIVYTGTRVGSWGEGEIYAVRVSDGTLLWTGAVMGGSDSSPAVTDEGLYVSYGSSQIFKLNPQTGANIWRYNAGVGEGYGTTPVYYNGRLYARWVFNDDYGQNGYLTGLILNAADGSAQSRYALYPGSPMPAFHDDAGFWNDTNKGTLSCRDAATNALRWSVTPPGATATGSYYSTEKFTSPPVVVNDLVFIGSGRGNIYAYHTLNGQLVWSHTAGASIQQPDEWNVSRPLTGLGAGEGLLLVPADNILVAYEPSLDTTPPATTAVLNGVSGDNGWYRSSVKVTLSTQDVGSSGVWTTHYSIDGGPLLAYPQAGFTVGSGFSWEMDKIYTVSFFSRDVAGNAETAKSLQIKIDSSQPGLTWGAVTPARNSAGWNNSAVNIAYTAQDNLSGVASATPGNPVQVGSEGRNQSALVTVTDKAGNSTTLRSPLVNIDLTNPVSTATGTGPTGANGWFIGPVTVTVNASDALSGLASTSYAVDGAAAQTYTTAVTVGGEGRHGFEYSSADVAGNSEGRRTLPINIDVTAPSLSITASPSTIAPNKKIPLSTVTVAGRVTDATSGVDTSSARFSVADEYGLVQPHGSVAVGADGTYRFTVQLDGKRQNKDRNGRRYTITVSAFDMAGHSASTSTAVTGS